MLSGCGQNIFKGLAGDPNRSSEELLKRGDFSAAIQKSDETLQRVQTGSEAQNALAIKATAILGQNSSLPKDALQVVSDLTKDTSANIVSSISNSLPISATSAAQAADLLNYADALSSSTNIIVIPTEIANLLSLSAIQRPISIQGVTNNTLSASLNSTAQFRRGFANGTVVVKLVTQYLDITVDPNSASASVTLNATAISESKTARDVVLYLHNPPKSTLYYAENGLDAFEKSGALTTDQLKPFKRIKLLGINFDALRTIALNNDSGSFVLKDEYGATITGSKAFSTTFFSGSGTAATKYIDSLKAIISAATGGN